VEVLFQAVGVLLDDLPAAPQTDSNLKHDALLQRIKLRQAVQPLDLVNVRKSASLALGRPLTRNAGPMSGEPPEVPRLVRHGRTITLLL
jgi:hypothetical protein